MKGVRILYLWLSLLVAALSLTLLVAGTQAASRNTEMSEPPAMTLVVDTTGGMGEEVTALATAWQQRFPGAETTLSNTYKLVTFRDQAKFAGATGSSAQMGNWLAALETAGDGTCPDNAFGALAGAARLAPRSPFSTSGALLLSDSAPYGSRPQLARIVNILAERDLAVHPVFTGWCPGVPLAPRAMDQLAFGTGGRLPIFLTDTFGAGIDLALAEMATPDLLGLYGGGGNAFADSYDIDVDSSIETLVLAATDEEDPCASPWAPLTCVRRLDPERQATVATALQLQVRDPEGNLITADTPGVNFSEVSGLNMEINFSTYPGPRVGTFKVEISGVNAGYLLRVSARSGASLNLLSPHTLPAGRTVPVVASLLLPAVQRHPAAPQPTEELFGAYNFLTRQTVPLELKDDGLSRDGVAGDGIYGGTWQLQPGLWQLVAWGHLEDGSAFRRAETAPIRVLRFDLSAPDQKRVMPGDNVNLAFTLQNDSPAPQQFELLVDSTQSWAVTGTVPASVTLAAGETRKIQVPLAIPTEATIGTVEETRLIALAPGDDPLDSQMATAYAVAVDERLLYLPLLQR